MATITLDQFKAMQPSWDTGAQKASQMASSYANYGGALNDAQKEYMTDDTQNAWNALVQYVRNSMPQLNQTMNAVTAENAAEAEVAGVYEDQERKALKQNELSAVKRGMSNQRLEQDAAAGIIGQIELQKAKRTQDRALNLRKEDAATKLDDWNARIGAFDKDVSNRQSGFERLAAADLQAYNNRRQDEWNRQMLEAQRAAAAAAAAAASKGSSSSSSSSSSSTQTKAVSDAAKAAAALQLSLSQARQNNLRK